jgi:hypothetical protein
MATDLVSEEVVARIHRDHLRVRVALRELQELCDVLGEPRLTRATTALACAVHEQLVLVQGVLDVVTDDEPIDTDRHHDK